MTIPVASAGTIAHPADDSSYGHARHGWKKNTTVATPPKTASEAPQVTNLPRVFGFMPSPYENPRRDTLGARAQTSVLSYQRVALGLSCIIRRSRFRRPVVLRGHRTRHLVVVRCSRFRRAEPALRSCVRQDGSGRTHHCEMSRPAALHVRALEDEGGIRHSSPRQSCARHPRQIASPQSRASTGDALDSCRHYRWRERAIRAPSATTQARSGCRGSRRIQAMPPEQATTSTFRATSAVASQRCHLRERRGSKGRRVPASLQWSCERCCYQRR